MGEASLAAELTLGISPSFHGSFKSKHTGKLSKIESYLQSLEEERKKIDAFKRELPLCIELLHHEIEASKEQLSDGCGHEACPLRGESVTHYGTPSVQKMSSTMFFPQPERSPNHPFGLAHTNARVAETPSCHSPVQAGIDPAGEADEMVSAMAHTLYRTKTIGRCDTIAQVCINDISEKPTWSMNNWPRSGGAFEPSLKNEWRNASEEAMETSTPPYDDQGVVSSGGEESIHKQPMHREEYNLATVPTNAGTFGSPSQQRKPRRCWSPELHRRFVNALQQLGGSEVATPKQIRELMQVGGLTNDEVKSHLQKYRLHTKRPNSMSAGTHAAAVPTPQLVVLGGIWVPQEYALTLNQATEPPLFTQSHGSHYLQAEQKLQLFPP